MNRIKLPYWKSIHTIIYDFDGVFTNNLVYVDQEGVESVGCNRLDGLGINLIQSFLYSKCHKINQFILSTEKNKVVTSRANKMNLKCYQGIKNKLEFIKNYLAENFNNDYLQAKGIIYIGNDLNDYHAMKFVGFSIAPNDAHPKIIELANYVLKQNGGEGCVRGFIEEFIEINTFKNSELENFI